MATKRAPIGLVFFTSGPFDLEFWLENENTSRTMGIAKRESRPPRWRYFSDSSYREAVRALGCREALSEDLSDGEDYEGVVVVNPFREIAE